MKNEITNTERLTVNGITFVIDYDDYDITFPQETSNEQIAEILNYLINEGFLEPTTEEP
jgi:hypothetical protein